MLTPPRAIPRRVSEAPHSPSCLLKMLASTQTATRPTRPSLPNDLVTATTFPMTSTGKNAWPGPNSSPTIIARQSSEIPRSQVSFNHPKAASNLSLIVLSPYNGLKPRHTERGIFKYEIRCSPNSYNIEGIISYGHQ